MLKRNGEPRENEASGTFNRGEKEFAVIERFRSDSAYAKANGEAEVLSAGADPVLLVEEYAASAENTLRGMVGAVRQHKFYACHSSNLRKLCKPFLWNVKRDNIAFL